MLILCELSKVRVFFTTYNAIDRCKLSNTCIYNKPLPDLLLAHVNVLVTEVRKELFAKDYVLFRTSSETLINNNFEKHKHAKATRQCSDVSRYGNKNVS